MPGQKAKGKVDWEVKSHSLPSPFVCEGPLALVTTVGDISLLSEQVHYIGSYKGPVPPPEAVVLLALCFKTVETGVPVDPTELLAQARCCRHPLFSPSPDGRTSHHGTTGHHFGFGSRPGTRENTQSFSTVNQFATKATKKARALAPVLESVVEKGLSQAAKDLNKFCGIDLVRQSKAMVQVAAKKFGQANRNQDFQLLGDTGCSSLFLFVNAATSVPHTEDDWTMTLLSVPPQPWNKPPDHMTFNFWLNQDQLIKVSMQPNTKIWFHAHFLTHHQQHQGPPWSPVACCVNFGACHNARLRSHAHCSVIRSNQGTNGNNKESK